MKEPAQAARAAEEAPRLPGGSRERVSGYGVMSLPFASGHVLGLRRWTASSVGEGFTSIWHRNPEGRWTFYESTDPAVACTRYFGASVDRVVIEQIALQWSSPRRLRVRTIDTPAVDWTLQMGSSWVTRAMSGVGSRTPEPVWQWRPALAAMGFVAGRALGAGRIRLAGLTSNGQLFDANPLRIWLVRHSRAVVEGEDLGAPAPLRDQAHLGDFYMPQRGIFALGRVFVTPLDDAASSF